MTADEKKDLVQDLFAVLESTGAKTLTELSRNKGVVASAMKTLAGMDKERRKRLSRLLTRFLAAGVETAAPETEMMGKVEKLEKFDKLVQNGKFDLKTALSLLEKD